MAAWFCVWCSNAIMPVKALKVNFSFVAVIGIDHLGLRVVLARYLLCGFQIQISHLSSRNSAFLITAWLESEILKWALCSHLNNLIKLSKLNNGSNNCMTNALVPCFLWCRDLHIFFLTLFVKAGLCTEAPCYCVALSLWKLPRHQILSHLKMISKDFPPPPCSYKCHIFSLFSWCFHFLGYFGDVLELTTLPELSGKWWSFSSRQKSCSMVCQ